MKISDPTHDIKRGFEMQLFHYGLIVSIIFRILQTAHDFLIHSHLTAVYIGLINLVLMFLLFGIYRKYFILSRVVYFSVALISSVLLWNHSGGWDGPRPYVLLVLVVFIVITSHGYLQIIMLLAYGLVLVVLSQVTLPESWGIRNENYSLLSLEIDFLVDTLILVFITLYLKLKFFEYRKSVEQTNERLLKATETMEEQTRLLHKQQMELTAIRNNLEDIVTVKTREVHEKADMLREYAFVNAHHVRGPLARVLGLIYLIELEGRGHPQFDTLDKIKREARKMDTIIQRINEVTS